MRRRKWPHEEREAQACTKHETRIPSVLCIWGREPVYRLFFYRPPCSKSGHAEQAGRACNPNYWEVRIANYLCTWCLGERAALPLSFVMTSPCSKSGHGEQATVGSACSHAAIPPSRRFPCRQGGGGVDPIRSQSSISCDLPPDFGVRGREPSHSARLHPQLPGCVLGLGNASIGSPYLSSGTTDNEAG